MPTACSLAQPQAQNGKALLVLALAAGFALPPATAFAQAGRRIAPEDLVLPTKDGVQIHVTYYASNAGKEAVPVVMLHDYNETRAVFEPLATALQNPPAAQDAAPGVPPMKPRAVITVDLRGHGQSKTALGPNGSLVKLDAAHFGPGDFHDMVTQDMEAVRAFLVERNDAGQLNLNRTCVVGTGMGANVGLLWTANDWAAPPLPVRKQGQDIHAMVLISPRWNFRGLALVEAMKFPPIQRQISTYLAFGANDPKVAKDCDNLLKTFERYHPEPPRDRAATMKDFFLFAPDTGLQGSQLLTSREFAMAPKIIDFIEARLGRIEFPWVMRKK
jgi:pimeloyl-ACP methyl ester carboxylesterase